MLNKGKKPLLYNGIKNFKLIYSIFNSKEDFWYGSEQIKSE